MQSMTGFGRVHTHHAFGVFQAEIQSVNSRFLEIQCYLPNPLSWAEPMCRQTIANSLKRGKVDFRLEWLEYAPAHEVTVNWDLLKKISRIARQVQEELHIDSPLNINHLLQIDGVLIHHTLPIPSENVEPEIAKALASALDQLVHARQREGNAMAENLKGLLERLQARQQSIALHAGKMQEMHFQRITQRLKRFLQEIPSDENRVYQEAALQAQKSDISEEITRLRAHITGCLELMPREPIGRELDFLVQEIAREINTIGSKGSQIEIMKDVVEMKAVVEQIREQVRNVE